MLNGLTEKYHIFASTLDQADVSAMQVQIERDGDKAKLLKEHVFQFDFLNDEFSDEKLPKDLLDILQDDKKRAKLIIYINPPYAEAATASTVKGTGNNKSKVATDNKTWSKYRKEIGKAGNEVFAQFLTRIYREISGTTIANFSKLKNLQSSNFIDFRRVFQPKLERLFIVPAKSFDNVAGSFPIGFFIWNTKKKELFTSIDADVFDMDGLFIHKKTIKNIENTKYINDWYKNFYDNKGEEIGVMNTRGNDFQNQNYIRITTQNNLNHTNIITKNNLIESCIYLSVRHCIEANWLNDRDQFFIPYNEWEQDEEFKSDCLTFALFNKQNHIIGKDNINYWIPFMEEEVGAKGLYRSHFMTDFIQGKIKQTKEADLFDDNTKQDNKPLTFSLQAQEVFSAAKELWKYYHQTAGSDDNKDKYDANASYYDIREFFQGRDARTGRMNNSSPDEKYNDLVSSLRLKEKELGDKIAKKVYQYGFLR